MSPRHVVVDGSNIATEGRTLPSLKQLNEAVMAFLAEYPDAEITVVVDASFAHRIDPSELAEFEAAEAANELVSPPAGAIGRGDAFLLRIAGKIGATVLSNDSFQEFHGEYDWLFTEDRLIGGKPVPGIGWIFTPRTPVRGIKSRKAVKDAKGKTKTETLSSGELLGPMPKPAKPPPRSRSKPANLAKVAKPEKNVKADKAVLRAIAVAAEESEGDGPAGRKRRRKRRGAGKPAEAINEPLAFITFIASHKLGSEVEGEVETFTSHGAFVTAGGARCYIPIVALGDPPPRAARDVLDRGEVRQFVVQALDPQRRGVELALPAFARISGAPRPETVEAEIASLPDVSNAPVAGAAKVGNGRRPGKAGRAGKAATVGEAPGTPTKRATAKRVTAKRVTAKRVTAKRAPAEQGTAMKATAAKATVKRAPAIKAPAIKAPAIKAPAIKAPAIKATAKRATAKRATAKRATARKATAKKPAEINKAPAGRSAPREAAAAAAPVAKALPKKAASTKVPAPKVPVPKVPAMASKKASAAKPTKKAPAQPAGAARKAPVAKEAVPKTTTATRAAAKQAQAKQAPSAQA
jgi:Zc3h12a-like Ribonuclease NYN domain